MQITLTNYPKIFFDTPGLHVIVAHTTNKENVEKFMINVAAQFLNMHVTPDDKPFTVVGPMYHNWEDRLNKLGQENRFMYDRFMESYNPFASVKSDFISQSEEPGVTNYRAGVANAFMSLTHGNNWGMQTSEDALDRLHEMAMKHNIPLVLPALIDPTVLDITSKSFLKKYESVLLMPRPKDNFHPIMPFYHKTLTEGEMLYINTAEYLF